MFKWTFIYNLQIKVREWKFNVVCLFFIMFKQQKRWEKQKRKKKGKGILISYHTQTQNINTPDTNL